MRRRLAAILLGGLFVAGTVAALFAERGYLDLKRSRDELEVQERLLREQVEKVRLLRRQVASLESEPSAVERLAREELGLVQDGEVVFLLPVQEPDAIEPDRRDPARSP
jgi:cell division protein FtsB